MSLYFTLYILFDRLMSNVYKCTLSKVFMFSIHVFVI